MTDAEFAKQAHGTAVRVGATNVVVVTSPEILGVSCDYAGKALELSMERHPATDQTAKAMILGAIARMGQPE